jgi:hypothetical protein
MLLCPLFFRLTEIEKDLAKHQLSHKTNDKAYTLHPNEDLEVMFCFLWEMRRLPIVDEVEDIV